MASLQQTGGAMFGLLVRWVTRYLPLAVIALLALAIICFNGAAGLGLPALFWCRPSIAGLLSTGFAVCLLFSLCSFVGFLLDRDSVPASLPQYFVRTFWLPTLLVFVRGVWLLCTRERCGREWIVLIGYAAGIGFVTLVAPWLSKLANPLAGRTWFARLVNWLAGTRRTVAPPNLWLHAYALLVLIIVGTIYLLCAIGVAGAPINAPVAICMLLALIVLGYGTVRFFVPRAVVLVALVLVVWIAAANQVPLKHRYQELEDVERVSLEEFTKHPRRDPALLDDTALLDAWRKRIGGTAKPKLIVVMTSGGGIRASVWTAAVLRELQNSYGANIRMITGASGGMVGAGYDVANRAFGARRDVDANLREVTADALDRVARYLVLRDVPALFLPWPVRDRGYALEYAWKCNAPVMAHTFRQLRARERTAEVPSLIYAPASLDDGRRVLVSNLRLDYLTAHALDGRLLARSAIQFFDLFDHDLSIATGARMSASFPWVSSATELPTIELRRIGDAGYFDNYGGFVTAAWLLHNRPWLLQNTSGVLVVQVRDTPFGDANRNIATTPDGPQIARRAFSEFAAPVEGALQTRTSVMYFRNDSDLAVASVLFGPGFLNTVEIELRERVAPLSWNLTGRAATDIIDEARRVVPVRMKTIEAWWKAPRG